MAFRFLTALLVTPLFACGPDPESWLAMKGEYGGCLCDGIPSEQLEVVDPDSWLVLSLTSTPDFELAGSLAFDGEIEVSGFAVADDGSSEYAIDPLRIGTNSISGTVRFDDAYSLRLEGDFTATADSVDLRVQLLGQLWLDRTE